MNKENSYYEERFSMKIEIEEEITEHLLFSVNITKSTIILNK